MLPTPSTTHVDTSRIYDPSEDSFLLLDTLSSSSESAFLSSRFPSESTTPLVVEIGTGSGIVLAFLTAHANEILHRPDIASLGVDVNIHACLAARETVNKACAEGDGVNGVLLSVVQADLSSLLRQGSVDVLIFNPPYVPTPTLPSLNPPPPSLSAPADDREAQFHEESRLLELSYAGGNDGMEITDRLLTQVPELLSERGVFYLLLCAQNKPQTVAQRIRNWEGGWEAHVVGKTGMTGGWEKLCVLRIARRSINRES